jgi:HEAT repeat protein
MKTRSLLAALAVALAWLPACKREPAVQDQVKGFVAQLQDTKPEVHQKAAAELMKIGQPAAAPVSELLLSEDPELRSRAASVIWGMGAKGAVAAPNLATLLADPQADVRVAAAMALENMGKEARVAVPALTKALDDPEGQVRMWAIRALGKIGPEAKPAVPALHRLSKKQPSMETLVREALQEIQR